MDCGSNGHPSNGFIRSSNDIPLPSVYDPHRGHTKRVGVLLCLWVAAPAAKRISETVKIGISISAM